METKEINNLADVIDSRDIIARIEELGEKEYTADEPTMYREEDEKELAMLKELAKQGEDYADDWEFGALLIRESYFEDYARELAEDIGAIPDYMKWPCNCIDWEQASRELQIDYTVLDFDGVTYFIR